MRSFVRSYLSPVIAMLLGSASVRPAQTTVFPVEPEAKSEPKPEPAITVDNISYAWSYRQRERTGGGLPGSFYMERAEAKRERKAEKLRVISRHWPQQQGHQS